VSRWPLRYAGWMARDVALGPGIPMLVVALLAALFVRSVAVETNLPAGQDAILFGVLDLTARVLVLLGTAGLVSGDFAAGYHRTLFAHPVSPPLYYLQRWLLGGAAASVAAALVAGGVAARLQAPFPWAEALGRAALLYLVLGGLVFLLSTIMRRDWMAAVLILIVQGLLGVLVGSGLATSSLARALLRVLPPFQLVRLRGPLPAGGELTYALVYGLVLLAGALAVLRWRPLASGARE